MTPRRKNKRAEIVEHKTSKDISASEALKWIANFMPMYCEKCARQVEEVITYLAKIKTPVNEDYLQALIILARIKGQFDDTARIIKETCRDLYEDKQ